MFLITASELRDIIATAKAEGALEAEARLREGARGLTTSIRCSVMPPDQRRAYSQG